MLVVVGIHALPADVVRTLSTAFRPLSVIVLIVGPGRRVPKATLVVVVVIISSLKIPKAFLIRSAALQNFAHTFVLIFPTDLPSQIFSYHFRDQSSFHVIDLKLDIEPSLNVRRSACSAACTAVACCSTVRGGA